MASPQDAMARAVTAGQAFKHDAFDPSGRMVKASYVGGISSDASTGSLNEPGYRGNAPAARGGLIQFLEGLPQSKGFTLMAAVGVIFVIAKRRLAAR
ncbi:hypothetical protein RD110_10035 [Rhodoferax koreense]|uniref:Uncharacterized protein n=2 Tax=Rhodoferax koreensis TaxID=1842727 RepID=A0A1P8JUP3_9BURK|nr:hypothetical protein RD110_10035 [Rhodoferax koreense]